MPNNNSELQPHKEPSISDLFLLLEQRAKKEDIILNMVQQCAKKADTDNITQSISQYTSELNTKIDKVADQVETVSAITHQNTATIEQLQVHIEQLKQDQLKNNICISGVPQELISNGNIPALITKISKKTRSRL